MPFVQSLLHGSGWTERATGLAGPWYVTGGGPKTITAGNMVVAYIGACYYQGTPTDYSYLADNLGNTYTRIAEWDTGHLEQCLYVSTITNPGVLTQFQSETGLPTSYHCSLCSAEFSDPYGLTVNDLFQYWSGTTITSISNTVAAKSGLNIHAITMWRHPTAGVGGIPYVPPAGYTIADEQVYRGSDVIVQGVSTPLNYGAPCLALSYRYGAQPNEVLTDSWNEAVSGIIGFNVRLGEYVPPPAPAVSFSKVVFNGAL